MVKIQKINVSEIDYRGSKSTASPFNYGGKSKLNEKMFIVVKEPRLDGGCIKQKSKALVLRYSLRGLDKNHQVKILSNPQFKIYSSTPWPAPGTGARAASSLVKNSYLLCLSNKKSKSVLNLTNKCLRPMSTYNIDNLDP